MKNKPLEWTTQQRRVNDLIPLDINPRKISEAKRMKMIESLQRFNLVDIPVVDFDDTLVSGHRRVQALQAIGRGEEMIDVRCPNRKLTVLELKEYNLLANSHFGEWDSDVFDEYFGDVDVEALGFSPDDFKLPDLSIIAPEPEPVKLEAKEDDYVPPPEIVTDIVPGDLFEIGQHRLLCGDSTSADDVEKVMGGEKADIEILDPLFDMEYKEIATTLPGVICIFTRGGKAFRFLADLCDAGYGYHNLVNLTPANGVAEETLPANTHEIIHILRKDKYFSHTHALQFCKTEGNFRATSVMNFGRPTTGENYFKYSKPIGEISYLFAYCRENGIILDPFLGSGTTMVAAHQLRRRCYGIEIDPKYCQVIVDRMLRLDPSLTIKRNGHPYEPKR